MTLIVLRIKTFFFIFLIVDIGKDCRQSPKELSEAPDYICLSWRSGTVWQIYDHICVTFLCSLISIVPMDYCFLSIIVQYQENKREFEV